MKLKKQSPQTFEQSAVILLASTIIVKLIGAVFKIPLQRLIGTLGFGYFSSAYDLFLPIYALSMAGLPIAVSRIVAENAAAERYKEAKKTFSVAQKAFLVTGFTGFIVILCAIFPYVKATTSDAQSAKYIALCIAAVAPSILFCCLMSSFRGYYEGMRNMLPTAISDIIEALGKLVLGLGIAYAVLKITGDVAYAAAGALTGIMIGTILSTLYLWLRQKFVGDPISKEMLENSPESKNGKAVLTCLLAIAVPVALSSLANNLTLIIDTFMIKLQLKNVMESSYDVITAMYANSIADYNATAKQLLTADNMPTFLYGIRGEAYTLYNLIPTLTTTLGIGAIPVLTTAWVKNEKNAIKSNIEKILRTTAIIAIPAGIGVLSISPYLMQLLYGDVASVEIGSVMLRILGVAAIFSGISVPITSMLQAIGKPFIPLFNIAVGAVLKIIVNILLVGQPSINIIGAPVGTTVCYFYIFVSNIICLIKFSHITPDLKSTLIKPLISGVACGVSAFFVSGWLEKLGMSTVIIVAVSMMVAASVYFALIFALKTLTAEDVKDFPKGEKIAALLLKLRLIK